VKLSTPAPGNLFLSVAAGGALLFVESRFAQLRDKKRHQKVQSVSTISTTRPTILPTRAQCCEQAKRSNSYYLDNSNSLRTNNNHVFHHQNQNEGRQQWQRPPPIAAIGIRWTNNRDHSTPARELLHLEGGRRLPYRRGGVAGVGMEGDARG